MNVSGYLLVQELATVSTESRRKPSTRVDLWFLRQSTQDSSGLHHYTPTLAITQIDNRSDTLTQRHANTRIEI